MMEELIALHNHLLYFAKLSSYLVEQMKINRVDNLIINFTTLFNRFEINYSMEKIISNINLINDIADAFGIKYKKREIIENERKCMIINSIIQLGLFNEMINHNEKIITSSTKKNIKIYFDDINTILQILKIDNLVDNINIINEYSKKYNLS